MRIVLFLALLTTLIITRDNGSCVDPDGRCKAAVIGATSVTPNLGATADPNG